MMHAMRRVHTHQRNDCRENQHQRAKSIDAQMVLNSQRRRPCSALHHAHAAARRQMHPHINRKREAGQCGSECNQARMSAHKKCDCGAHNGQHGHQRQYVRYAHARLLQIRITASTTTANASQRRYAWT